MLLYVFSIKQLYIYMKQADTICKRDNNEMCNKINNGSSINNIKKKKIIIIKRNEFVYIGQATNQRLFTGAIPLLLDTGTSACCVSALGRSAPP